MLVCAYQSKNRSVVGWGRSAKSLSITKIEPKFEPNALKSIDCPDTKNVWPTPGGLERDVLHLPHQSSSVRSVDAESGSCTLIIR